MNGRVTGLMGALETVSHRLIGDSFTPRDASS
jgi:hypothetical protein